MSIKNLSLKFDIVNCDIDIHNRTQRKNNEILIIDYIEYYKSVILQWPEIFFDVRTVQQSFIETEAHRAYYREFMENKHVCKSHEYRLQKQ